MHLASCVKGIIAVHGVLEGDWGERRGLNPRPSVPQTDALPAELRSPMSDFGANYTTVTRSSTIGLMGRPGRPSVSEHKVCVRDCVSEPWNISKNVKRH